MADILIRGMEMPQDCGDCYLCHDRFCYGLKKLRSNKDYRERPDDCPLVELPEHGDLIDRDVARDKIAEQETSYYMDMDGVDNGLLETPVIIPASKEETE